MESTAGKTDMYCCDDTSMIRDDDFGMGSPEKLHQDTCKNHQLSAHLSNHLRRSHWLVFLWGSVVPTILEGIQSTHAPRFLFAQVAQCNLMLRARRKGTVHSSPPSRDSLRSTWTVIIVATKI